MKSALAAILAVSLAGCMSTRVVLDPKWDSSAKASYEDYFDYYFFGLSGHPSLNLQKVCMDQKTHAFKRFKSPEDAIITWLTLGIYAPATVRVWCGD